MSLVKPEFVTTWDFSIEDEIDIKEEPPTEEEEDDTKEMKVTRVEGKCGEIFVSQTGNFILICAYCNNRFENMHTFGEHMETKHLRDEFHVEPNSRLETIDSTFNQLDAEDSQNSGSILGSEQSKEYLTKCVEKEVVKKQDWYCEICCRNYMSKKSLHQHIKRFHIPKLTQIAIKEAESLTEEAEGADCKKNEATAVELNLNLLCDICNRQYPTMTKFKYHALRHGKSIPLILKQDPSYLKCKYCLQEFSDRRTTLTHERNHSVDKRFQCSQCPKTFRDNTDRKTHENTHTGECPFKCTQCPRSFRSLRYLAQHVRIHSNSRKFSCEVCGKGFHLNAHRIAHMRQHTGEKPYQCEECGMRFMLNKQLHDHRYRHAKSPPFKCDVCGKGFYTPKILRGHKAGHSDERPHECSQCESKFSRRKALLAHMKIHSDIKEYVCGICGKAFAQAAGLCSHRKSHKAKCLD